jgi:hypothetical protein
MVLLKRIYAANLSQRGMQAVLPRILDLHDRFSDTAYPRLKINPRR